MSTETKDAVSTGNEDVVTGKVHDITSEEDLDKLLDTGKLVVIDWYAHWCAPCQAIKATFQKMAEEQTDVLFCKIDVDELQELAAEHRISSMPTFQASTCYDYLNFIGKCFIHGVVQIHNTWLFKPSVCNVALYRHEESVGTQGSRRS